MVGNGFTPPLFLEGPDLLKGQRGLAGVMGKLRFSAPRSELCAFP